MSEKLVLLVGPLPPPWGGASVAFRVFCDYLIDSRYDENNAYDLIDTNWRVRADSSLFTISGLLANLRLACRIIKASWAASHVVVFGSQRFVSCFGALLALLCPLWNCSVSIRIFGGAFDEYLASRSSWLRALLIRMLGRCRVVCVEPKSLERSLSPLLPGKIVSVPNYRWQITRQRPSPERRPVLSSLRFIYTGFVSRSKGIDELLEAFGRLYASCGSGRPGLSIVGPIVEERSEVVCLSRVGVEGSLETVRLFGELSHELTLKTLEKHDVFIFPSHWPREGLSGAVIEAMTAGLPVVAARWRFIDELVEHDVNGLLYEPGDVEALVAALSRLMTEDGLWTRLARGARESSIRFAASSVCRRLARVLGVER